jgi:hypothetical protein
MHKELSILTIEHPAERRIRSILVLMLLALTLGYLYCVSASVMNVIARKEAVAKAASLESSIGSLEQDYFELAQTVTPASGERLGLSPVAHTAYVHKPSAVASALSNNEI